MCLACSTLGEQWYLSLNSPINLGEGGGHARSRIAPVNSVQSYIPSMDPEGQQIRNMAWLSKRHILHPLHSAKGTSSLLTPMPAKRFTHSAPGPESWKNISRSIKATKSPLVLVLDFRLQLCWPEVCLGPDIFSFLFLSWNLTGWPQNLFPGQWADPHPSHATGPTWHRRPSLWPSWFGEEWVSPRY